MHTFARPQAPPQQHLEETNCGIGKVVDTCMHLLFQLCLDLPNSALSQTSALHLCQNMRLDLPTQVLNR